MPNFQTYEHCESNIIYENKKNHLINFFQKLVDDMSEYEVCHISGRDAMMDIDGMWQVATANMSAANKLATAKQRAHLK